MLDPGWVRFMLDLVGDDSAVRALLHDKPSRRERKARRNLVMFKTAGRRPWANRWSDRDILADAMLGIKIREHDWGLPRSRARMTRDLHGQRLKHLREPSGFVSMSRVAEEMRLTKALTPVFVDEAVTYTEEQLKAIETWIRETWGDLKPAETAEKLGRGEL